MNRKFIAPAIAALMLIAAAVRLSAAPPASNTNANFAIDISQAQPRQVEEATQQAIVRDYSKAWQNMAQALEQNRTDLVNQSFVGIAREKIGQLVSQQKQAGLKRRYVDRGHKLEVLFYSYEGSALQLRDTAQLEIQVMDGDRVLNSKQMTVRYTALLTPTESAWKVRILEATP